MSVMTAYLNILETSAVTLTAGAEDASAPLWRLYDRNIGRMFKTAAAVTLKVLVDQGASPVAVDRLLVPSGHNLAGMTLNIKNSSDNITFTPAVTQWTGMSGLIDKSWAFVSKRYWEFSVTTPASIPQIPELFLTSAYAWPRNPSRPSGPFDPEFNVLSDVTASGQDRFLVMGAPKRVRRYTVPRASTAMRDSMLAFNAAWAGAYPFWLCDNDGVWIFGKLTAPLNVTEVASGSYSLEFDFEEVLP